MKWNKNRIFCLFLSPFLRPCLLISVFSSLESDWVDRGQCMCVASMLLTVAPHTDSGKIHLRTKKHLQQSDVSPSSSSLYFMCLPSFQNMQKKTLMVRTPDLNLCVNPRLCACLWKFQCSWEDSRWTQETWWIYRPKMEGSTNNQSLIQHSTFHLFTC